MAMENQQDRPLHHWGEATIRRGIENTSQRLNQAVDRVYERVDDAQARVQGIQNEWRGRAMSQWDRVTEQLEEYPGRVIGISFLAGVLTGLWLTRSRR